MSISKKILNVVLLLIALLFTWLINEVVPEKQFDPFRLQLDSVWSKETAKQEYLVDLNHDTKYESIHHYNINKTGHSLAIVSGGGIKMIKIFNNNEFFISGHLTFADVDNNGSTEILFLTATDRLAILNIQEYTYDAQMGYRLKKENKITVDTISYYNHLPDANNYNLLVNDTDIWFDLQSMYSIQPRNIYNYNSNSGKLTKTARNSIVCKKLELLVSEGHNYLLAKNVIASGNTVSPAESEMLKNSNDPDSVIYYEYTKNRVYKYGDFASYILLYNTNLNFEFEPIEFFGWTNYTKTEFLHSGNPPGIIALTNTVKGDTNNNTITICGLDGRIAKQIPMPYNYTNVFTSHDIIVFDTKNELHQYSEHLQLVKKVPDITHSAGFIDIDQDEENEFVAFRNNKLIIFSKDFDPLATLRIDQEFAPLPDESGIQILHIPGKQSFTYNSRLFYYLFSYSKNRFAIFKYPFYIAIFFFSFGLLTLILKLNSKRLEHEKRLLEKTVTQRTAELQFKNQVLVIKNAEIQTQAKKISKQYEDLEKLDRFKESMTHALVHDLKNPLSQIMLKTSNQSVSGAARKMLRLITNMLDVEKYEHTGFKLNKETHSLPDIILEVAKGQEISMKEKNLELKSHFSDRKIEADKELMIRIFDNLLSNAIRFSPLNGSVDIFVEQYGDNLIKIVMRNYGEPIPEEALPYIFDKYRQFGKNESSVCRTTGIGLTFCKMAVEAHGGLIGAQCKTGVGCDFWFTIPCAISTGETSKNLTVTEDIQPIMQLTATNRKELQAVVKQLKQFEIYEISHFHEVLDPMKETSGSAVNEWISLLFSAINIQNRDEFNRLIKLAENE